MLARMMGRTVAELHATMSLLEMQEWRAFLQYEAWHQGHASEVAAARAGAS